MIDTKIVNALIEKRKLMEQFGKDVVFCCDMDGVLAEWEVGCTYEKTWEPHYFLYRDLETVVRDTLLLLMAAGFKCQAASAAYEEGTAREDKDAWLNNNGLETLPRTFMPCGKNKADYIDVKEGVTYILLDDYTFNLTSWEATDKNNAKFVAVKFLNGINGNSGDWSGRTIHHHSSAEIIANTLADLAVMA
jgi:hypothetical protein